MKTFKLVAAQGEVNLRRVDALPAGLVAVSPERGMFVISHSENGNSHVIDAGDGVTVLEREDVPAGMRVLYALIEQPTMLRQDATVPHETVALDPGIYLIRISREYDPFAEQARRVAD